MAAEARPDSAPRTAEPRRRIGFALFAAVIVIAVIAVMATVVAVTLSGDNDQARIERTADVLHRLVAAMDTSKTFTSFGANVTQWPGHLSQLTTKIASSGDLSCSGAVYGTKNAPNWKGPYYLVPIPTTGYQIAPGFFANDLLVKVSTTNLAIQMNGVSLHDAQGLELFVEKTSTGAGPVVTFALTDPTTVQYHLISATTIC
jgi:type II secretory pathway pseudopilin PulG